MVGCRGHFSNFGGFGRSLVLRFEPASSLWNVRLDRSADEVRHAAEWSRHFSNSKVGSHTGRIWNSCRIGKRSVFTMERLRWSGTRVGRRTRAQLTLKRGPVARTSGGTAKHIQVLSVPHPLIRRESSSRRAGSDCRAIALSLGRRTRPLVCASASAQSRERVLQSCRGRSCRPGPGSTGEANKKAPV